jgi:hypothetical protein
MRELTSTEIQHVSGGGVITAVRQIIIGGAAWDAMKSAASWFGDTFLAKDGSGGSRYPIEDCEECS